MFYQQRMIEEFTIDEILKKTDSLYKSYEDIYKYIIDYNSKFDTIDSYSAEILNLEKHDSYEAILIKLVGNNLDESVRQAINDIWSHSFYFSSNSSLGRDVFEKSKQLKITWR